MSEYSYSGQHIADTGPARLTHNKCDTSACCKTCNPHTPTVNEVETFSGRYVDTGNPQPDSIVLEDIAHALAALCRFGGHTAKFYSVAEHSVFVSRLLEAEGYGRYLALAGLHHDSSEAYLGDIPRPLKLLIAEAYGPLSAKMDCAIAKSMNKHGPPWLYADSFHDRIVKWADNQALLIEANHLMPSRGINWEGSALEWGIDSVPRMTTPSYWTGGLEPKDAEGLFLSRHWELIG